jgi:hypothetical protein
MLDHEHRELGPGGAGLHAEEHDALVDDGLRDVLRVVEDRSHTGVA